MFRFIESIVFSVFFLFSLYLNSSEAYTCPTKGKVGGSQIPLVTSLVSDQTGYQTKIELVSGSGHLIIAEEIFNQRNLFGILNINDGAGHQQKSYWYHLETKESFFIDSDQSCSVSNLTDTIEKSIIDEWLAHNSLSDESEILSDPQVLGPILLFTYMRIKSDDARYLGEVEHEGRKANRWFYCLKDDGPYLDVFFDSTNNYPIRLIASYPDNPTLTTTVNVISFETLTIQSDDLITYPYGYGCNRLIPASVMTPKFGQSDTFTLNMEAALFFTNPDRSAVTSAQVARHQGIYSYDLRENGISKRIVHDPKLLIDFLIDPISGTCVEGQASSGPGYGFTYMRWPYSESESFNLLDDSVLNLDTGKLNYLGQIVTDNGRLDIFEKRLISFFALTDESKYDAIITYFFPAAYDKRQSVRIQAPIRMEIKPMGELNGFSSSTLANKIEINVYEYQESAIDFENRFDISGCFDERGGYSWFQIVFSGRQRDLLSCKDQNNDLRKTVRSALSFIPEIRIPEMQVSYLGNVIYVSFKLLERPSFQYEFYKTPGFILNNPTKIIQRDHESDCSEVCSEDESCSNFAYCNNLECRLFSSKSAVYPQIDESTDCDGFGRNSYFVSPNTEVEANFLKSSKRLIHEIKIKLTKGELNMKNPDLSALDLFIVSGPDQFGDPDTIFKDNNGYDAKNAADHYEVLMTGRRLSQGNTMLDLDYASCLKECDNDDDCLVVSFCSSRKGECVIGNSTKNVNEGSTILSGGCNILSRSFLSFFKKFPGRSLILDAEKIIKDTNEEDCARACATSSQSCEAFDYCPETGVIENSQSSSSKVKVCFLHSFHIAKDSANAIDGKVWDFSETQCDHYAKFISKDYKQLVGLKLDNQESMISSTSDVSLENCAGSCTTTGDCISFDYCESQSQSGLITSKCRLSSIKPDAKRSKSIESSLERCSIYVSSHVNPSKSAESHSRAWMIISFSFFTFVIAFALGLVTSRRYFKR